jgi:cyclopropane fatty-acyl-phospholipid synthase-like methyltransferase
MSDERLDPTVLAYQQNSGDYVGKRRQNPVPNTFFLEKLVRHANLKIHDYVLEIGPGLGYDAKWLADRFPYTGVEPVERFAREITKITPPPRIIQTRIQDVTFPDHHFKAIYAMASLLHLDNQTLLTVLRDCERWLQPNGVLYASMKEGVESRTLPDGRFMNFVTTESFLDIVPEQLELIEYFRSTPTTTNTTEAQWLNFFFKRTP